MLVEGNSQLHFAALTTDRLAAHAIASRADRVIVAEELRWWRSRFLPFGLIE